MKELFFLGYSEQYFFLNVVLVWLFHRILFKLAISLDKENICTSSRFDFITKTNSRSIWRIQPEMEARIIKQPDITRNGPQRPSRTA